MTASVFPIGHYGGVRATTVSGAAEVHTVRVGRQQHQLVEEAFGVWVLAHGMSQTGKDPWTADDVMAQAEEAGLTDIGVHLDELLERRLLAVVPDGPEAVGFARDHRMDVLFVGLGNGPDRPDLHAVGVPGIGTAALLDPDSYELWQWGSLAPTLWHSCEFRTTVTVQLGQLEPVDALAQVLGDLRYLIAHGCAYLDVAARG